MQILVAPVQQQRNGSDCGVFATCLAHFIDPVTVDFDISKMRPHLLSCLKSGDINLFPTL